MTGFHVDPMMDEAIRDTFLTHPYYSSAVTKLRIVADESVPTMATSAQWVTHYNPATLAGWTRSERAAVLVHELEHLLRGHPGRCGDRDPAQWNVAADAEINQRLDGLPDGAVYPETLGMPRGRVAELYYSAGSGADKPEPGEGAPGEGAPGEGAPGEGAPGEGAPGEGAPAPAAGKCGSAAGGPVQEHERGDAVNPGQGARNGGEDARKEVANDVLGGWHPGLTPGNELREWAEATLGIDRASWYSALASAVGSVAAPYGAPTRWQWPGRRDPRDMGGAMVPRWTGERPSCAVIIDTSSSITPGDLDMARAAGHYVARMADVTYYGCDTTPIRYGATLPDRIAGGGGTDLRQGIKMAIEDGARAVVIITDCETPWPMEPTRVPLIIGANPGAASVLANPKSMYYPPEWTTVLPIMAVD